MGSFICYSFWYCQFTLITKISKNGKKLPKPKCAQLGWHYLLISTDHSYFVSILQKHLFRKTWEVNWREKCKLTVKLASPPPISTTFIPGYMKSGHQWGECKQGFCLLLYSIAVRTQSLSPTSACSSTVISCVYRITIKSGRVRVLCMKLIFSALVLFRGFIEKNVKLGLMIACIS